MAKKGNGWRKPSRPKIDLEAHDAKGEAGWGCLVMASAALLMVGVVVYVVRDLAEVSQMLLRVQ